MDAQMLPRRGPSSPRIFRVPSFAGRGLLERTRSTGFAALGITAAMGLGLVALLSQQGLPYLPASPIPEYGTKSGSLDGAISVASAPPGFRTAESHGAARRESPDRSSAPAGTNDSSLTRSDLVASSPDASEPTGGQPSGERTPPPAVVEPDPAPSLPPPPAAAPAPAPSSPPAEAAANPSPDPPAIASGVPGKGNAYGRQKPAATPAAKPSRPSPHASSPPVAPAAAGSAPAMPEARPAAPAAAPGSDGPGNGHGNAYGHDK
jgi:hypothetical protein